MISAACFRISRSSRSCLSSFGQAISSFSSTTQLSLVLNKPLLFDWPIQWFKAEGVKSYYLTNSLRDFPCWYSLTICAWKSARKGRCACCWFNIFLFRVKCTWSPKNLYELVQPIQYFRWLLHSFHYNRLYLWFSKKSIKTIAWQVNRIPFLLPFIFSYLPLFLKIDITFEIWPIFCLA